MGPRARHIATSQHIRSVDPSTRIRKSCAMRPAVPEIRKRGAHVRTCTQMYHTFKVCVKRIGNGSLITPQISAQSAQLFPRYGKGTSTCGCTPSLTYVKRLINWSLTTHQVSTQSAKPIPKHQKQGYICTCTRAHVQMYPNP